MGVKLTDGTHTVTWTGNSINHGLPGPRPFTVCGGGNYLIDQYGNELVWNDGMGAYVRMQWNSIGPPTVTVWTFEADGSTACWSSHMGGYAYWGTYT